MATATDKYLLSEPSQLRMIKRTQWLLQLPFILLLFFAFLLNYIFRSYDLYSVALIIALFAITGFLFVGACFRFRQRIPIPASGCVASPLQGKVKYVRSNEDVTVVNIRRMFLDSVEIRSPHPDCRLEEGLLKLSLPQGTASLRFNATRVRWMDSPDFTRGNIIGMIVGTSSCTVSIPKSIPLSVKAGDLIDTGDPLFPCEDKESKADQETASEPEESNA